MNIQQAALELLGSGATIEIPDRSKSSQSRMCLGLSLRTKKTIVDV